LTLLLKDFNSEIFPGLFWAINFIIAINVKNMRAMLVHHFYIVTMIKYTLEKLEIANMKTLKVKKIHS